jgi:hypothetical protein
MTHVEELGFESDETGGEYADEFVIHTPAQNRSHTLNGLPQHAEGQSVHVGTPKINLGTHPGWEYAQTIKDSARARQFEWLMVERRLNGRVHGTPKIIHLKPKVETLDLSAAPRDFYPPQYQQPTGDIDERIMRAVQHALGGNMRRARPRHFARAAKRLHGRERQSDQTTSLLREQMERERVLLQERSERERQHQEELRARDRELFEERLKRVEEQATRKENPAPASGLDGLLSQVLVAKVQSGDEDIQDRLIDRVLGGDGEQESGWSGLFKTGLETVKAAIENPANAAQLVQALGFIKSPAVALQPPQIAPPAQPASAPQQEPVSTPPPARTDGPGPFEQELNTTLSCVLSNLKDDAPVFTAARSVVWLFRTFPQESAQLQQLLEQPASMIQATIAQMIPQAAEIVSAPHAGAWLDKLKANVSKRLQRGTPQPADTQVEGAPRADVSNVVELSGRAS